MVTPLTICDQSFIHSIFTNSTWLKISTYTCQGVFINRPGRADNRYGSAGVTISYPVYENFIIRNSEEPRLEFEDVNEHIVTSIRAKMWSIIRGWGAIILQFDRFETTRGMKFTPISDN